MITKLVAAVSVSAFLGILGGYLIGHRETDRLRTDFEARAQILERAASDSDEQAQKAASDARELAGKVDTLGKSNARLQWELRDLTMKLFVQAQHEKAAQLEAAKMKQAFARIEDRTPLTVDQVVTIAQAFHDIEHHVAAREFPGLALTNAYQRLKGLLDNTDIERLIADHDTVLRQ